LKKEREVYEKRGRVRERSAYVIFKPDLYERPEHSRSMQLFLLCCSRFAWSTQSFVTRERFLFGCFYKTFLIIKKEFKKRIEKTIQKKKIQASKKFPI